MSDAHESGCECDLCYVRELLRQARVKRAEEQKFQDWSKVLEKIAKSGPVDDKG